MIKVGAILLARLDSSRLPGKALRPIAGRPLVARVMDLCRATPGMDLVGLATSDREIDDPLASCARENGIECFRGNVDDVAGRFFAAMETWRLDGAVRVNGDSPFNRPALLRAAIEVFRAGNFDLVSNLPGRTYPFGLSVEVISRNAMRQACDRIVDPSHREHVTKYFYDHPEEFRMQLEKAPTPGIGGIQLAVDSPDDALQAEWMISQLGDRLFEADAAELAELSLRFRSQLAAG